MGCDIHLYVEKRVDGKWATADKWTHSEYDTENPDSRTVSYEDSWYTGRNYELFSVLAGVRNRYDIIPISEPRGIPDDVSPELKQGYNDCYEQSGSWLTLAEILSYDWTQSFIESGYISVLDFFRWESYNRKYGERPNSWCQDVGGGNTKKISEDAMRKMISDIGKETKDDRNTRKILESMEDHIYCFSEWSSILSHVCSEFWSTVIPRLLRLGDPKDVRIVFWFDS